MTVQKTGWLKRMDWPKDLVIATYNRPLVNLVSPSPQARIANQQSWLPRSSQENAEICFMSRCVQTLLRNLGCQSLEQPKVVIQAPSLHVSNTYSEKHSADQRIMS